jgi:Golgi phosphoprotein 3
MSGLTQRANASGLVQRRTAASTQAADGAVADREEKLANGEEEEDHDSKETRLTLMEEVLLLGLKDREVMLTVVSLPHNFIMLY